MKRVLVASSILFVLLALSMLPTLIDIYRGFSRGGAFGIGFVIGPPLENVLRVLVFLLLVLLSIGFWENWFDPDSLLTAEC